mmetsp:Transcript_28497/g.33703  ORF Transcript_28497/g.33703 Transcript_28497/m.33703 type:complete len:199 (+) Transcript_28497:18-614(+)
MADLIAVTSRMKEAGALINTIDASKFPFLLTRIVQKLHLRNESIFSDVEHEQLCGRFSLSDGELRTVLEALSYVFEQAAYHTIRPASLPDLLMETGMDEGHAAAVAEVWEEGATGLVAQLKEHTMSGPSSLTSSQYRLHLVMGESNLSTLQDPAALFELGLTSANGDTEKVAVEFNHNEMYDLFLKLERIQEQLDGLS